MWELKKDCGEPARGWVAAGDTQESDGCCNPVGVQKGRAKWVFGEAKGWRVHGKGHQAGR